MKILLLGKPGSGKGTHTYLLSAEFKIPRLIIGDLLREEIKKNTELGKEISKYYDKGILVPDEIVIRLVKENLEGEEDFIADGFPRNLKQAEGSNINFDMVFYLNCSDKEIMKRLINRRVCVHCGKVYNLVSDPPKKENICDLCGSKLMKRVDETKEAIKKRLEVFKKETFTLIDYYKKKGNLIDIDGDPAIETIYNEIKSYLSKKINK